MDFSLSFGQGLRIGIQMKDHIIRCVMTKKATIDSVQFYAEKLIPEGLIEKGKIEDPLGLERFLKDLFEEWKIKRKKVRFSVPDANLFFRKIEIPNSVTKEETRGYINFEIGASIHLPFEEAYFDYYELPAQEDSKSKEILLFAVPESLIKSYVSLFDSFKSEAIAADVSSLSIYRLFSLQEIEHREEHYLFVDWDINSLQLSIFHQDLPLFIRQIPVFFNREDWILEEDETKIQWIPREMDKITSELEDTYLEVRRIIDFYKYTMTQGENEITKIFLTGDHPLMQTIGESLAERSGLTVETAESLALLKSDTNEVPVRYLQPLSLCLKEVN